MTNFQVYQEALKSLKNPDVDEINIRIILCEVNSFKNMTEFFIHKDEEIRDLQAFRSHFAKFLNGEPIQYIFKKSQFLGEDFYVDNRVLIPRQETEEVVTYAINKIKEKFGYKKLRVLDVCCGSGIMGISLAKKVQNSDLVLSDISKDAIDVAKINLDKFSVDAKCLVGDALSPVIELQKNFDVVVSNPPYIINKNEIDESAIKHEPINALVTSDDLDVYRKILQSIQKIKDGKLLVVFEIGYDLKEKLTKLIEEFVPDCEYEFVKDMNGKERILSIFLL